MFLFSMVLEHIQKQLFKGVLYKKCYKGFCKINWKTPRGFSSSLLHSIISHKYLPFFKIPPNFVHFCPNFQKFCLFLNFFALFLPFFWKIVPMPLLSRIGPDTYVCVSFFTKQLRWLLLHIITSWLEHCFEIFVVQSLIQNPNKYLRRSVLQKYLKRISTGYSGDAYSLQTMKSGDCWYKIGNACIHVYSV